MFTDVEFRNKVFQTAYKTTNPDMFMLPSFKNKKGK